jgi:hypothetical protein
MKGDAIRLLRKLPAVHNLPAVALDGLDLVAVDRV